MAEKPQTEAAPQGEAERAQLPTRRITAEELFQGSREVVISHNGEEYRLRITSRAKLILTK